MSERPPETRPARTARLAFAAEELRLMSAVVVMLGLGLFLALPFVLSIGSVVFLPIATATVMMIVLAPLADRLARWGLPNVLASLFALVMFFAILLLALALILQPAVALFDSLPAMVQQVAARFAEFQSQTVAEKYVGRVVRQQRFDLFSSRNVGHLSSLRENTAASAGAMATWRRVASSRR